MALKYSVTSRELRYWLTAIFGPDAHINCAENGFTDFT